jgi:hypothetical protein
MDSFRGAAGDQASQHGDAVDEAGDVAQDHLGLLAVGGEDHDDGALARCEGGAVVAEAGEEDGD